MWLIVALWPALLLSQPARPQTRRGPPVPEEWWTGKIERPLHCSARKYPATLGFDFRYWTGLDFAVDLKDFLPLHNGRRLYLLFRVTPEGKPPRFFMQRQFVPPVLNLPPETKLKDIQLTMGGGVHLGAGKYRIEAMVADQDGRACRHSWNVNAKAVAESLRQEPLTVETPPPAKPRIHGEMRQRVAIIANADTFGPRRYGAKLSARDRSALLDSLQSLADTWDTADFSFHLLDIESRRVLLTEPQLERSSFERMDEALRKIDMATVDIDSLKRGARGGFLAEFVERNSTAWTTCDALIFIGPAWRWFDRLPDAARKKIPDLPKVFHLAFTPVRFPPENLFKQFVASQDGQVLDIHYPADLARAIKRIRQEKR